MSDGARLLVVGAGGLGSPLSLALAADPAVAKISLIDPDVVELSNLHRQILLSTATLGQPKVQAAAAMLTRRSPRAQGTSPSLRIHARAERLTDDNCLDLLRDHDLVIDGSDDLHTKFRVNDAACALGKVALIGGIVRFVGQLQTIWPGAACYRCLFEDPPPPGSAISCQQAGVLGPACGLVAGLMAQEVRAILRRQPAYAGAVLTLDLLRWQKRRIALSPRPDCPACGHAPSHAIGVGKIDSAFSPS